VEQFLPAAREKGIEIRLEPPGYAAGPVTASVAGPASAAAANPASTPITANPVTGDYNRLMQVFINLISNGVKYTGQGAVTIRAALFPEHYEVSVTDTGIGIGGEELPRVFDRFYRTALSRSRGSEGSGIGLSIAKTIVEAHGGTITVESEIGRGSVFRVRLPLQE
jgi:signal transduction histidine kinase